MKKIFKKSPALFAAAAVLLLGSGSASFKVQANTIQQEICSQETVMMSADQQLSEKNDEIPYWTEDMANEPNEPVGQYNIHPDTYYILKTEKYDFWGLKKVPVYTPVKVTKVFEDDDGFFFFTTRKARYFATRQKKTYEATLTLIDLYEITGQDSSAAAD